MSDNGLGENNGPVSGFKSFGVNGTGKTDEDNTAPASRSGSDSSAQFKILYEGDKGSDEHGIFVPAYPKYVPSDIPLSPQEIAKEKQKKAYEEGFAKGEASGRERAAEIIEHIQSILNGIEVLWKNMIDTYEKEIVQLVGRAAEKVVYGKVDVDQEIVKNSILHAFELIPEPVDVTVNVNPEDYEYIEGIKDDIFTQIKDLKHVSVLSDPAVSRGGCKVETRTGEVDASTESRLAAIKESIIEANEIKRKKSEDENGQEP